MNNSLLNKNADTIGIISSFLCLVHCIALPVLISVQPVLIGFIAEDLHFLEYIFLGLSFVAVYFATRNTSRTISILFYIVLSAFTLGIVLEETLGWMKYLGYIGSVGLILTHIYNIRYHYQCRIHRHHHHSHS